MGEDKIVRQVRHFFKRLSGKLNLQRVILFGSRAEGSATSDSDVDLVVVSQDFEGKKFHQRPRELYLAWNLRVPVDFICLTPKEFSEKSLRPTVVSHALQRGLRLV